MRSRNGLRERPNEKALGEAFWRAARHAAFVACILLSAAQAARAAETVIPVTPPGATDVDQAFLPPPGLYGAAVLIPFNQNYHAYDTAGNRIPAPADLRVRLQLYVPAAIYVYPFQLFGGSIASTFVQPVEDLHYSIGSFASGSAFGLADAYSDLFYWTKNVGLAGASEGPIPLWYGLSVGGGLAFIIPDGEYNTRRALNPSGHFWVIDPNVAATYNTGPHLSFGDNTQVSSRVFYGIATENPKTRYQSGQVFDVDYSVTEQFGSLRVGAAGYYQTQVTNDRTRDGVTPPDGNKFSQAAAGPIVEYFIPRYNMLLKAKYQFTFYHKNFVDEQLLVLTAAIKF